MGQPNWIRPLLRAAAAATVLAATLLAWGQKASDAVTSRPPNIIVIMSDEHNASVLGCYGNSVVRTPHLDSLARRGICFDAAYTPSPLCVPARLAFTAGKYISRTGAWNNNCWLPSPDYPSLPRVLNAAGYESFLCGKMHYDATRRYGFTEIGGNFNRSFKNGHGARRRADNLDTTEGYSRRFDQFGVGEGSIIHHDREVTSGTVDFLSKRRKSDKPFFLLTGYLAPHFPLQIPEQYWTPYKGKVAMPQMPAGTLESLPLNYKHLRLGFHVENVPDDVTRKSRELYYGLTQWLDDEVGKVLGALEASEVAEDTIVIYTTDHGEDMGEHGMWFKNCLYEHGARVPLIVAWPKRWQGGQRRAGACSLLDVVQTIAELGGASVPADWNGSSMCRWMDDPATPWKDLAVSEYYAHLIASGFVMVRSGNYKYVYHTRPDQHHGPERELYDLAADPGEFHNLAALPEQQQRVQQMHALLVKEVGEDPEQTELRCRAETSKGYGRTPPGAAQAEGQGKGKGKGKRAQRRAGRAAALTSGSVSASQPDSDEE